MPTVAAFAEGSSIRDQFFPDYKADAVTAGVRSRWTFFDSGQTRSKVAEASAGLRSAEARAQSARRDIEVQTVVAWEAFQSALAQTEAAAADENAPLPTVPVWADEIRVARGLPPEAAPAEAAKPAAAGRAAAGGRGKP